MEKKTSMTRGDTHENENVFSYQNNRIEESMRESFREYVKRGLFSLDFIGSDHKYYSGGRCHSRVLGILVQSIQSLGYITDIERKILFKKPYQPSGKERNQWRFTPDITVVDKQDNIVGIIG